MEVKSNEIIKYSLFSPRPELEDKPENYYIIQERTRRGKPVIDVIKKSIMMPDYEIGIVSFSNLTYASTSFINLQVLDTLIAIAKLQPRQLPASAILNQRKNKIINLLPEWKNAEATHIFAENFLMDYFPDSLRREAVGIFNRAGKIIHIKDSSLKIICEVHLLWKEKTLM